MYFRYIIIFTILLFIYKVLSSPIDNNNLSSNKDEVSRFKLKLSADDASDVHVKASDDKLANTANTGSDSEIKTDTEVEADPVVEIPSENILYDEVIHGIYI